ncbi:hypothetical protein LCGC14_1924380 [marine sediment metagenome]|uniref:Uncharacterized protein n=1 Tax=marine sediment metagenome TaxID=412755 RepID=A0A0F9I3Q5_9ZZZZ
MSNPDGLGEGRVDLSMTTLEFEDYERQDAPIIQTVLQELGYEFTLEDVCEFWREYSDRMYSAGWLDLRPREHLKENLRAYITHLRADALETLKTFPQEPK